MLPIQFKSTKEIVVLRADLKDDASKEALSDCLYLMFNTCLCREISLEIEMIDSFLSGSGVQTLSIDETPVLYIQSTKKELWFRIHT